jgi:hypothetical protein
MNFKDSVVADGVGSPDITAINYRALIEDVP